MELTPQVERGEWRESDSREPFANNQRVSNNLPKYEPATGFSGVPSRPTVMTMELLLFPDTG